MLTVGALVCAWQSLDNVAQCIMSKRVMSGRRSALVVGLGALSSASHHGECRLFFPSLLCSLGVVVPHPPPTMDQIELPPLLDMLPDDGGGPGAGARAHGAVAEDGLPQHEIAGHGVGQAAAQGLDAAMVPVPEGEVAAAGVERPRFANQQAIAAYARATLAAKGAVAKAVAAEASSAAAHSQLRLAAAVLPAVAKLTGARRQRVINKSTAKPAQYCAMALAAFLQALRRLRLASSASASWQLLLDWSA